MEKMIFEGLSAKRSTVLILIVIFLVSVVNIEWIEASETVDWWPMFGHDARHTGTSLSIAPNTNDTLWTFEIRSIHTGALIVSDDILFVGPVMHNEIYALNATTGTLLWNYTLETSSGTAKFLVNNEVVYIAMPQERKFCAFKLFTWELLWSFVPPLTPWEMGWPVMSEGIIFLPTLNAIYALNASTGSIIWSWESPTFGLTSPAVVDGMVFVSTRDIVYCLDQFTGIQKWNFTHGDWGGNTVTVADGMVFIGSDHGIFYALNETNGQLIWSFTTDGLSFTIPSVHNGRVFFGTVNGKICALNASTGDLLWSYQTDSPVTGQAIVADGKVFAGSRDGVIYAIDEVTGSLIWSYDTDRRLEAMEFRFPTITPVVANGLLYVSTGIHEETMISQVIAFGPIPTGFFRLSIASTTGGTTSPMGIKIYPEGSNVTVEAIPDANYIFDYWELNGVNVGSQNPITVTMNTNHNLTAYFKYSPPVGGHVIPIDKFALLALYVGLASTTLAVTVAAAIYVKQVKQRRDNRDK